MNGVKNGSCVKNLDSLGSVIVHLQAVEMGLHLKLPLPRSGNYRWLCSGSYLGCGGNNLEWPKDGDLLTKRINPNCPLQEEMQLFCFLVTIHWDTVQLCIRQASEPPSRRQNQPLHFKITSSVCHSPSCFSFFKTSNLFYGVSIQGECTNPLFIWGHVCQIMTRVGLQGSRVMVRVTLQSHSLGLHFYSSSF